MTDRPPTPASDAWYQAMTDDQLKIRLAQSMPGSRDWEAARRVLDGRASTRLERRNIAFAVAGLVIGAIGAAAAVFAIFYAR